MPDYLIIADGERWVMKSPNRTQAEEDASIYNGNVIREVKDGDSLED